jgi:hypothetical protein
MRLDYIYLTTNAYQNQFYIFFDTLNQKIEFFYNTFLIIISITPLKMINLWNLLPDVIKNEIFHFDNTFHTVFKKNEFKHELSFKQFFITNRQEFINQFYDQLDTIIEMIFYDFNSGQWRNEYGVMSCKFYEEEKEYDYLEHGYKLKFFPEDNDIIKFKIIPFYPEAEDIFMNSTEKKYDGFVCSSNKHRLFKNKLLPKPIPDTFCQYEEVLKTFEFVIYLSYPISS